MSTSVRQSRSKSRSPRTSVSSSKRRALHARSDSDTNELAGKHAAATDEDPVYRQSPFPRLPSQVLSPKESLSIFEDQTATAVTRSHALPVPVSQIPKAVSPGGRVKSRATIFNETSPASYSTVSHPPSKKVGDVQAVNPLRANPVEASSVPSRSDRASSRVRSIVSAIESAKGEGNHSLPSTPKPPTPKAKVIKSQCVAGPATVTPVPVLPPVLPHLKPLASNIEQGGSYHTPEVVEVTGSSNGARKDVEGPVSPISPVSPLDQPSPSSSRALRPFVSSNIGSSSNIDLRPRSASTPTAPTDAFLAALVAGGTTVQYPKLEKPSVTSLRSDTSSFQGAFPQPLTLRRKRARSHLSHAESATNGDYDDESSDPGEAVTIPSSNDDLPSTPPKVIEPDSGRWTPGRWTAELEDTVAPLDRHPLRAQHSYYRDRDRNRERDLSNPQLASKSSMESISSSGGFYRFLNDSRTAWAKAYYCNESALRLVTPPHVIQMSSLQSPITPPSRSYTASGSGPTQTPESDGYVESIFIPRARPLQSRPTYEELTIRPASSEEALPPSSVRSAGSTEEMREEDDSTQHGAQLTEPVQAVRHQNTDVFGPMPRPRPEAHLSPDRGVSARYSLLQPPSLDGFSWHSPVNAQVSLFIFGIIFPFGK